MASALPPIIVDQKTVKGNLFSKHDNCHAFQSSGCYFGQGLGKRLQRDSSKNQHHSENHTTWQSQPCYISVYQDCYNRSKLGAGHEHRRCSSVSCTPLSTTHVCKHSTFRAGTELLSKFETATKGSFRRFPRSHSLPDRMISVRPSECTKWWYRPLAKSEHAVRKGSANEDSFKEVDSDRKEQIYVTPLSVLASTQQPFLKHNPWTYAYKK